MLQILKNQIVKTKAYYTLDNKTQNYPPFLVLVSGFSLLIIVYFVFNLGG